MNLDEQLAQRADAAFNQRVSKLFLTFKDELDTLLYLPDVERPFSAFVAVETFKKSPNVAAAIETMRVEHRAQFVKELVDRITAVKQGGDAYVSGSPAVHLVANADMSAYRWRLQEQDDLPMAAAVKVIASSIAFWVGVAAVAGAALYFGYQGLVK